MRGRGACLARGGWGMHGRGACIAGGACVVGGHAWQGVMYDRGGSVHDRRHV